MQATERKPGTTIVALSNGNVWVLAEDDLVHNECVFGHGFYTAVLDADWVLPGMTPEFASQENFSNLAASSARNFFLFSRPATPCIAAM